MPNTLVKSGWSSGILVFEQKSALGAIHFGVDDTGLDVKFFGATSGKYMLWDESADKLILVAGAEITGDVTLTGALQFTGAVTVGVDGTGHDVKLFGDTASCYALWDQSEDQLTIVQTNAVTSGTERSLTVSQTHTGAGADAEVLAATLNVTNVLMGTYANAIFGKVDLKTTGRITGLVGAICAEIDMPGGTISGDVGTYAAFEAEFNVPTSFVGSVPMDVMYINTWGAVKAAFDTTGYFLDINGVTSNSGKFWYANKSVPFDAYLRIKVNGTPYYIGCLAQQAAAS